MNIPDYTLLHCCGRGAYGEVWLAKDQTGRSVALKYLANSVASEKELAGLKNYAKLPASPHLIRIFHVGKTDDGFFYTMELADCLYQDGIYSPVTLAYKLNQRTRFTPVEAVSLGISLTDGLNLLHKAGLVHRDIKPENILYVNGIPKLSDVGLVRSGNQSLSVGGTLGFIPPERLTPGSSSGCQVSDDVYALGKVLYCALTGCRVEEFPSFPSELMQDPIGRRLNKIILKACGPEETRFSSPAEFQTALQGVLDSAPSQKKLWLFYPLAALLIVGISVVLFLLHREKQTEEIDERIAKEMELMELREKVAAAKTKRVYTVGLAHGVTALKVIDTIPDVPPMDDKEKDRIVTEIIASQYNIKQIAEMRKELHQLSSKLVSKKNVELRLLRLFRMMPPEALKDLENKLDNAVKSGGYECWEEDEMRENLKMIKKSRSQQPASAGNCQNFEEDPDMYEILK